MDYEPYKYVRPEDNGHKLYKVKRSWLFNVYTYVKESPTGRTRWQADRHPNWLAKVIAVLLFPASVLQAGIAEAWHETGRFIYDRRTGRHSSQAWWTDERPKCMNSAANPCTCFNYKDCG